MVSLVSIGSKSFEELSYQSPKISIFWLLRPIQVKILTKSGHPHAVSWYQYEVHVGFKISANFGVNRDGRCRVIVKRIAKNC